MKRSMFFIFLLTISALTLAGTAAYFSIFGLSKLFVSAGYGVIILASSLEFSKLVAVSYVYRYWSMISHLLKIYYIFGIVFIMLLTSMGVYSYLVSAYQSSANKVEIRDSQIRIAENKKTLFVNQLDRINKSIESSNNRIDNLTTARNLQEKRIMSLYEKDKVYSARSTEKQITGDAEQIRMLNQDITDRMKQASSVNDSIAYYDQKIVEYKASDVSSEVGPLKYLSDLTGLAMNKVVNILVLLIIFVFDPMAISLLIGVNQLTMMEKGVKTPLSEERVTMPKINNIFRRKKNENNNEENNDDLDENIKHTKKSNQKEIKKIVYRNNNNYIIPTETEYQEETIEENVEEVENEEIVFDEKCPEGYNENRIALNKEKIRVGLRVFHDVFGNGIIKNCDNRHRILIDFSEIGIKELSPDFANLKEIICVEKKIFFNSKIDEGISENVSIEKSEDIEDISFKIDDVEQSTEEISEKKNPMMKKLKNLFKKK